MEPAQQKAPLHTVASLRCEFPGKCARIAPANPPAHGGSSRAPVPAVSGQMAAPETPIDTAVLQRLYQGVCKKGASFSATKLMGSTASYTLQRASYVLLLDAETLVMHKSEPSLKMKAPPPKIISKNKAKNEISFPGIKHGSSLSRSVLCIKWQNLLKHSADRGGARGEEGDGIMIHCCLLLLPPTSRKQT